jgi:ribosomal-protein-alanine N-acetyltransferase
VLETKRLILRKFTTDDFDELLEHRSDEEVMKFLGGVQGPEMIREKIELYSAAFERDGHAFCVMIWKETGGFIGVGGLQTSPETGETEVGYTVDKKFWGKGIATECTLACLEFGFETAGLKKMIARTHSENAGSIRVLEKAGMEFEKENKKKDGVWVQYKISKDEYDGNKKASAPAIYSC